MWKKQITCKLTLFISSRAASPLCLERQARITLAPLLARSMAVVFPMPVLLPKKIFLILHGFWIWMQTEKATHHCYQTRTLTYQSQSQFSHATLLYCCFDTLAELMLCVLDLANCSTLNWYEHMTAWHAWHFGVVYSCWVLPIVVPCQTLYDYCKCKSIKSLKVKQRMWN